MILSKRRSRTGFLLVLPAVVLITLFFFIPLILAFVISLTDYPLFGSAHFVGLSNYSTLFSNPQFWHSLLFTIEFTLLTVPISIVLGYLLAHFMAVRSRMAATFRVACLVPVIIGITTISYMFVLELQPGIRSFDFILSHLGLVQNSTAFLVHPTLALLATAAISVWAGLGFTGLLFMAGLQGIGTDVYEAGRIDGTSSWSQEWYITIPLMRRTLALVTILGVVTSFLVFSQFLILTSGGPGTSTTPLVLMIYSTAFDTFHVGYGTAISVVLFLFLLIVSGTQFALLRERS